MTRIIDPTFATGEDDYRRERITASFRSHARARRRWLRRRPAKAPEPAIDWYGG